MNSTSPGTCAKWSRAVFILPRLAYFAYVVFMVRPWCSLCVCFLPFSGRILFILLSVSAALFIQSLVDGHLGSFSLLAVVSPAAMNVDRHLDTLNQDVLWPHST